MRILRSKKAVSTVIAQILMISATMTIGAIAISWAIPTLSLYQSNAGLYYQQRSDALKESFIIEDVWFNSTGGGATHPKTIDITLRNVGSNEINIVAVYINGSAQTNYVTGYDLSHCQPVPVGQRSYTIRIQYNGSTGWVSGKSYVIVVATKRGNQVVSTWGV